MIYKTFFIFYFLFYSLTTFAIQNKEMSIENSDLTSKEKLHISKFIKNDNKFQTISYGSLPHQQLTVYPSNKSNSPVLVIVENTNWLFAFSRTQAEIDKKENGFKLFNQIDFTVVVVSYSETLKNKYPRQILDISESIFWITNNINKYNGNSKQIILYGEHFAGNLVSLMGSNPKFLQKNNALFENIKIIISVNGAYDLIAALEYKNNNHKKNDVFIKGEYLNYWYNHDKNMRKYLADSSPESQIKMNKLKINYPIFYLVHSNDSSIYESQAISFEKELIKNDIPVKVFKFDLSSYDLYENIHKDIIYIKNILKMK